VDTDLPEVSLDSDFCDHPGDRRIADVPVVDCGLGTHRTAPANDSANEGVGAVVEVHDDNDHRDDHRTHHNGDRNDPVGAVHASCRAVVGPCGHRAHRPGACPVYRRRSHCGHCDDHPRPRVDVLRIPP